MRRVVEAGYVAGPWSEMELLDLGNCVRLGEGMELIADFLCRRPSDVRDKITELRASGELDRLVAEAAAGAQD